MIEDNLALPFETKVLGVPVIVERIDLIPILDLPLPSPRPAG